jgi:ABC-type transport system involved in cytochrome c biogenesis ATPase subunit
MTQNLFCQFKKIQNPLVHYRNTKSKVDVNPGEGGRFDGLQRSGKSVLMMMLAGLNEPEQGRYTITQEIELPFFSAKTGYRGYSPALYLRWSRTM